GHTAQRAPEHGYREGRVEVAGEAVCEAVTGVGDRWPRREDHGRAAIAEGISHGPVDPVLDRVDAEIHSAEPGQALGIGDAPERARQTDLPQAREHRSIRVENKDRRLTDLVAHCRISPNPTIALADPN